MKGLTATILIFIHAIQCQRRKLPEIINPRVDLTSSVGISVEKADGTVIHKGTFKNKLNSGWQCRRLKLIHTFTRDITISTFTNHSFLSK